MNYWPSRRAIPSDISPNREAVRADIGTVLPACEVNNSFIVCFISATYPRNHSMHNTLQRKSLKPDAFECALIRYCILCTQRADIQVSGHYTVILPAESARLLAWTIATVMWHTINHVFDHLDIIDLVLTLCWPCIDSFSSRGLLPHSFLDLEIFLSPHLKKNFGSGMN